MGWGGGGEGDRLMLILVFIASTLTENVACPFMDAFILLVFPYRSSDHCGRLLKPLTLISVIT